MIDRKVMPIAILCKLFHSDDLKTATRRVKVFRTPMKQFLN